LYLRLATAATSESTVALAEPPTNGWHDEGKAHHALEERSSYHRVHHRALQRAHHTKLQRRAFRPRHPARVRGLDPRGEEDLGDPRARDALIAAGTGTIVGTCELVDVRGPLTSKELVANAKCLNAKPSELKGRRAYGDHTYAWVLKSPRRLKTPVRYKHPSGAIIWVKLGPAVATKLGK
jgi:hypothetical protein